MFTCKKIIFLASALFVSACSNSTAPLQQKEQLETAAFLPSHFYQKHWQLVTINKQIVRYAANFPKASIVFDNEKHKIFGNSGCNRFFGTFSFVDEKLNIGPVGSTQMACQKHDKIEFNFLKALSQARVIQQKGETMFLFDENNQELLAFKLIAKK